ncbi:unnamed protein product [Staurois parvus]|uniref:Secreted protein n=1 Tax=Staurois parvus TaxID=386267 RepID=A0ABN9E8L9_9NEOB|nr:unnamed protein product [Staurois parvus]
MGPRTVNSHAAAKARNLSWAPVRLLMLLPGPECVMVPVIDHGLPLLLSPSPHSAMCHFQVSSHCWWVPFFHRRCCMASHCCWCLHRHTVAPHSGFGPVTAQMSEVCGDSRSTALICMSY